MSAKTASIVASIALPTTHAGQRRSSLGIAMNLAQNQPPHSSATPSSTNSQVDVWRITAIVSTLSVLAIFPSPECCPVSLIVLC